MLRVSSHDLAEALASRLNEVVPAGFSVRAEGPDLVVVHGHEVVGISGAPGILETVEALREPAENLETAVRSSLSGVQDYIAEATTEPWPGTGGRQPNPDARVEATTVWMWFGSDDAPVLRLPPIDFAAPA